MLDEFVVDESRLIPIKIEIARYPPDLIPLLSFDPITMASYTRKLNTIGLNHWRFEDLHLKLKNFTEYIAPLTEDEELARFVGKLSLKCATVTTNIQQEQDKATKFLQEQSIVDIAQYDYIVYLITFFIFTNFQKQKGPTLLREVYGRARGIGEFIDWKSGELN